MTTSASARRPLASGARRAAWRSRSARLSGGLLLVHFWFGSIFLINAPLVLRGGRGVALCRARVEESAASPRRHRSDCLLGTTGVTCLTLAIIEGPSWGWHSATTLSLFAGRARRPRRLRALRAAPRRTAARRAHFFESRLLRRGGRDRDELLRAFRLHLPHHSVLSVDPGLLGAVGGRAHSALRGRRDGGHTTRGGYRPASRGALRRGGGPAHRRRRPRLGRHDCGARRLRRPGDGDDDDLWPSASPSSTLPPRRRS